MAEREDQRVFSRIPFAAVVKISNESGSRESTLLDISLKGALITRPTDWQAEPGEKFTLELDLDSGEDVVIRMQTRVAHSESDHIGLHCDHIDVDSITHLRRLIELNLGNPELLDRELAALSA